MSSSPGHSPSRESRSGLTKEDTMKKGTIVSLFFVLAVSSILLSGAYPQTEKAGVRKTLTLPSGEEICDLNGEWDVVAELYGPWRGIYDDVAMITQEGASFSSILMNEHMSETMRLKSGRDGMRGELSRNGFTKVQLWSTVGLLDAKGRISDDCNKMVIDDGQKLKFSCKRK
jgi:hypothetical protein